MPQYRVFDDQGNLLNRSAVNKALSQVRRTVRDLYRQLLRRGMNRVEGRALCDCLIANVSNVAVEEMLEPR